MHMHSDSHRRCTQTISVVIGWSNMAESVRYRDLVPNTRVHCLSNTVGYLRDLQASLSWHQQRSKIRHSEAPYHHARLLLHHELILHQLYGRLLAIWLHDNGWEKQRGVNIRIRLRLENHISDLRSNLTVHSPLGALLLPHFIQENSRTTWMAIWQVWRGWERGTGATLFFPYILSERRACVHHSQRNHWLLIYQ